MLVNVPQLMTAYFTREPDPTIASQRVSFGTSGHRGSAFNCAFNQNHIRAITQAICLYRHKEGIDGPLYVGIDTHALSEAALASAVEVLVANNVTTMLDAKRGYTPTPLVSHAILAHNRNGARGRADGIVITPSHNPPEDGGFKYNAPHGGPADIAATHWIEDCANRILENRLKGPEPVPYERALQASCVHRHDYVDAYVDDLKTVIDMDAIRGVKIGIDPLGGASVPVWTQIIERYGMAATITNTAIDPTFQFMNVDRDGKIRMDCSSPYVMARLLETRDQFDIAIANDTDADRHGIVCRSSGLINPNYFLAVAIDYLCRNRPDWRADVAIGKTVVSSSMIDRVAAKHGRRLFETPVGFKWFVEGLGAGSLGFAGEESAGASFLRLNGSVWTTDKDGMILGLLAAEMTARLGRDPGELYGEIARELGPSCYDRIDAKASAEERQILGSLKPEQLDARELAGEPVETTTTAPGNNEPIGGVKVSARSGWFAARPSGTEDIYKIYAESFRDRDHLKQIQNEAQGLISEVFKRHAAP